MNTPDTHAELEAVVRRAIEKVAPEVVADLIDSDADYREEVGLDSMDFIALLTGLERETGVTVPELDYPEIMTIDALATYLLEHIDPAEHHDVRG